MGVADESAVISSVPAGAGRERLLLDFGWRFHFGNANDPAKDFGFGSGRTGNFQKTGNFLPAGAMAFDDGDWQTVDLPHDWAVELPFKNDPALASKGFYPLGRTYPATSVGWYRRVFELPAADAGKRITIEFDGSYRETMVVFNGFYIGRHSGGYDPFSFDVTDFATPGGRNVLLVRVDATLERWLVLRGSGDLPACLAGEDAPGSCEAMGNLRCRRKCGPAKLPSRSAPRWITTARLRRTRASSRPILDPSGKAVGKAATALASIPEGGEQTYEQEMVVKQPAPVVPRGAEPLQAGDGGAKRAARSSIATRRRLAFAR